MYKLIIQKRALNSIIKTVEYIREDNPFYANQVQEYIKQSINLLSDYPLL
jgi:plasmid stabilization system protein ParE